MSPQIRVFVVDDLPVVVAGIKAIIHDNADILFVDAADSVERARDMLARDLENVTSPLSPTVLVLDLNLGRTAQRGEYLAASRLADECPHIGIIAYSVFDHPQTVEKALKAGCDGYVTKGDEPEELVSAIVAIAKGQKYLSVRVRDPRHDKQPRFTERQLQHMRAYHLTHMEAAKCFCRTTHLINATRQKIRQKLRPEDPGLVTLADVKAFLLHSGLDNDVPIAR